METYMLQFAIGSDTDDIFSEHPGQEFCYILDGQLDFMLDGKPYILRKGDSMYFNSTVGHKAKNNGGSPAKMLWIITPPNI
jgi:uncharacterized cupin superfamily protein